MSKRPSLLSGLLLTPGSALWRSTTSGHVFGPGGLWVGNCENMIVSRCAGQYRQRIAVERGRPGRTSGPDHLTVTIGL